MEAFQQFLPLALISILLMFICRSLAREKGKNITLWTILGLVPAVNYYSILYLPGELQVKYWKKKWIEF